ncbi:MAG: ABC transporter substrate-binding protein [Thiolinea sp.]
MKLKLFNFVLMLSFLSPALAADTLKRSFAWPLEVKQLDPHQNSSDTLYSLIGHYLAPLVEVNEANEIVPALAESWQISQDGQTIDLLLRKDAKWSDGVAITAETVRQSLIRALSFKDHSDAQVLLLPIKGASDWVNGQQDTELGIELVGPQQIRFHLERNNPDFLRALAFPIASPVPIHLLEKLGHYPSPEQMVSSGPYRLAATGKHFARFERNEQYFGPHPAYDSVEFTFDNYKNLIDNYLSQNLDTLEYTPSDQMPWLSKHMKQDIRIASNNGAFYLVAKHPDIGGLDDELRQSLLASLDPERINQLMTLGYFPTMSNLIPWQNNHPVKPTNHDPAEQLQQTRQLLEKRGYSEQNPLKICIFMSDTPAYNSLFTLFSSSWRFAHIELEQKAINNLSGVFPN